MNEQLERIVRHPATIPAAIGALSFGGGVGLGFFIGRKTQKQEVMYVRTVDPDKAVALGLEMLTTQLPPDETLGQMTVEDGDNGLVAHALISEKGMEELLEMGLGDEITGASINTHRALAGMEEESEEDPDAEPEHIDVFNRDVGEWDQDSEDKARGEVDPYIIHRDEFFGGEAGFDQTTVTFYLEDNIVADTDDEPILNYPDILGELKFGHGSGDPHVVYIRNPTVETEYEVLLHPSSFAREIQGLEIEAEGEAQDRRRASQSRFRDSD